MPGGTEENLAFRGIFPPDFAHEVKLVAALVSLHPMDVREARVTFADLRDEVGERRVRVSHAHAGEAVER